MADQQRDPSPEYGFWGQDDKLFLPLVIAKRSKEFARNLEERLFILIHHLQYGSEGFVEEAITELCLIHSAKRVRSAASKPTRADETNPE